MKNVFFVLIITAGVFTVACQHDTPPPCTAETINYAKQIQPILTSNCAYSGCHDGVTRAKGVQLTDYSNVKKYVTGNNAGKLYQTITATGGRRMPPSGALPQEDITLIKKWIDQGGLMLDCN
jgi:hypothetical protein